MDSVLPVFFALTMAFGVAMYVISDGFDLGIGILFLIAPSDKDRDVMMNSVAPIWDGNETWLVFGGTVLIGAFPIVYATVLPALYLPLSLMLLGLVFRGVAFEYRFRAGRSRRLWDWFFCAGSALAAFMQGVALGAYIQGIAVRDGIFVGDHYGFVSPFTAITGLGLLAGYALLGATWLVMKTDGSTRSFGRAATRPSLAACLLFLLIISVWTPLDHESVAKRWFTPPNLYYLWIPPALTLGAAIVLWRAAYGKRDVVPFIMTIAVFILALLGLGITLWPYAVPYSVTFWQAASSPTTQEFLAIGTIIIVPIVLAYLAYAHWVFRGKTAHGRGYSA